MRIIKEYFNSEIQYDSVKDSIHPTIMLGMEETILKINFESIIKTHYVLGNLKADELNVMKAFFLAFHSI